MSDQRYTLAQEIRISGVDLDCPVEIEKGALLIDNETNKVLLQLRLNILGIDYRQLSSVSLRIFCFDDLGDYIAGFHPYKYTFTDINLSGIRSFEDGTPILLDFRTRRVEIAIEKIVFMDGHERYPAGHLIQPSEQKRIDTLSIELRNQVNRDTFLLLPDENREHIQFIPKQLDDLWMCTCGRPNRNRDVKCCRCGIDRKWLFRNLSETGIQRNLERYEETLQQIYEEERQIKEQRLVVRQKWQHQLQRAFLFILFSGVFLALFFYVGNPYIKYVRANSLLKNADYDQAISIYESLGDFQNSEEMIKEATYEKAYNRLANRKFEEAIALFAGNSGYRNSKEMVSEAKYQQANYFLSNQLFNESIMVFASLENYKDSNELVHEAYYKKAKDLLDRNNFEGAAAVLSFNRDYKDSDKLFNKAYFLWGMQLMGRNQWEDAKNILSKVDKSAYPEVSALIEDAQKRIEKDKKEKKDKQPKK
jgi:TolA-binding protein